MSTPKIVILGGKRYRIVILKPKRREFTAEEKAKRRKRRFLIIKKAKSARSKCKHCREVIQAGSYRVGLITFIPHRNVKWHHFTKKCLARLTWSIALDKCLEWDMLPIFQQVIARECWAGAALKDKSLRGISGPIDMDMMATALTGRYNRFRSFRFALPEDEMYTPNWDWRCFISTILVSGNRETTMLYITDKLFSAFPDQESLLALYDNPEERTKWTDFMDTEKLKHAKMKMRRILYATKIIMDKHGGKIPESRDALLEIPGVGPHVSSVTLAWVHQAPEFGIDVHVRRIMERWGWIPEKEPEAKIEILVKSEVPKEKLGHFSRAFVDHGQSICGYVPDCTNCYLNKCCPAASKYLDW